MRADVERCLCIVRPVRQVDGQPTLEDEELVNLVDLMRDLRATEARRHVREEVPFYTGRRIEADQIAEVLR